MATAASRSFGEGGVDGCRVVQKLPQIEEGKKEFCGQTLFFYPPHMLLEEAVSRVFHSAEKTGGEG